MAKTFSYTIVSSKMDILVKHKDYLQTFVDETNQVLQLTTSWLSNDDTSKNFTSSEINKMIDDKLAFLVSTDFSVGCGKASTEQNTGAVISFPSASRSTDQLLPAGHVHVSGVTVASDEIKTILNQVNVMQEAMSSLSTSSKMLSEKQLAMEKLVESLSDKYSKVEQEKLREIEGELEGIKEELKSAVIQQGVRMTRFEKKVQVVTDSQSDVIKNCSNLQIKVENNKTENEKLKAQSQQFTKDLNDVSENVHELFAEISFLGNNSAANTQMGALEEEIKSLKESLEELSTRFEEHGSSLEELSTRFEEHGSSLEELSTRCEEHGSSLEGLSTRFEEHGSLLEGLSTRFEEHGSSIEGLSTRFEEHGSSLEELTGRNDETLKVLSSAQESGSGKLQKLEEKLSALENSWSETTVENGKLCHDVETKYEMVCQVVTDRLVPLERLRDIFNGKLDARAGRIKKLDNVCDQMTYLLPKILQIEQRTHRQAIGSSVKFFLNSGKYFANKETLLFNYIKCNIGDHYDYKTGEFTAPLDGLYAVYLSVVTKESDYSDFKIIKQPCSCEDSCNDCVCAAARKPDGMTQASTFGLVEMKAGNKLFVKCFSSTRSISIKRSKFICFKIL